MLPRGRCKDDEDLLAGLGRSLKCLMILLLLALRAILIGLTLEYRSAWQRGQMRKFKSSIQLIQI